MNWDLLRAVFKAVQLERDDTPTRQNLTGVMQKLSLRRGPQSIMISMGVVSWLSRLLESSESLSEYSLHYTLALLMNLSLRSKGRAICVQHCPRLLAHLSRFLQLDSAELRSYANGVLYRFVLVYEMIHPLQIRYTVLLPQHPLCREGTRRRGEHGSARTAGVCT